jgi:hypothetical protein
MYLQGVTVKERTSYICTVQGCPVERLGMDENWLDVTQVVLQRLSSCIKTNFVKDVGTITYLPSIRHVQYFRTGSALDFLPQIRQLQILALKV